MHGLFIDIFQLLETVIVTNTSREEHFMPFYELLAGW